MKKEIVRFEVGKTYETRIGHKIKVLKRLNDTMGGRVKVHTDFRKEDVIVCIHVVNDCEEITIGQFYGGTLTAKATDSI